MGGDGDAVCLVGNGPRQVENADFIAAARTAIPDLLDALDSERALNRELSNLALDQERDLNAERALADRLAAALKMTRWQRSVMAMKALAAYRTAREEK